MLKVVLLQFLELNEIFRLSMTCTAFRKIIDPKSGPGQLDQKQNKKKSNHLKIIAAIQKLKYSHEDQINNYYVDEVFGLDVQRVADFAFLNGYKIKDELFSILQENPQPSQKEFYWVYRHYGTSLYRLEKYRNPLMQIIKNKRISYMMGGLVCLQNVACWLGQGV